MADIAKINLPDGNTYDIVDKKSGYYKKPTDGIPKSDLSADVQTSLNKADSALPLSGGTVTGETTFNDNVHLENETYADSVTAGSLLVTGDARFVNGLYGNLKGNADTASSVAWDNITGKPTSYTPSSHTHDDRYYTESEINTKVSDINSSITSHTGNKSNPHGVTKSQVGLGNVDNTSDINKPVSTAQQSAIDTAYANSNAYTDQKIADLINGAPSTLDTLGEIATAMAEHEDVVSALNEAIGTKASQSELDTHTGNNTIHITASERTNWNSAKTHADSTHARTDATKVEKSSTNGNIKINGTETTVYTHPSGTNPHGTTKSDVGLSNVPNVATNDQTPSYTEATALAKLTSGEKLSVAFGKISKAITDLISHIGNKSNPHGVTKSQVGLGNVENKSSATIRSELTKDNVTTALGYTPPTTNTTYGVATSSVLGLVKSGTDITVDSSGNVSVNDDSHNHVISNVDGLQSALDGKISKSCFYSRGSNNESPYNYIWLCRIGNSEGYCGLTLNLRYNARYHSETNINIHITTGQYAYSGSSIYSFTDNDSTPFYFVRTANDASVGYDYYDIYANFGMWNKGSWEITKIGGTGKLVYLNKGELFDTLPDGYVQIPYKYANASHGNHVPATQTANNAVFLRNDNTWQTVTPANIGAAPSSHTHNYAGSSSAGGAADSAKKLDGFSSKVYPISWGTLSGSDYTYVTRLDSANGGSVAFADKSGQTSLQIDGYFYQNEGSYMCLDTNNYKSYCTPANIGAALSSHTHSYLPIAGGTMTGGLNFANGTWNVVGDDVAIGDHNVAGSLGVKGINGAPRITLVDSLNNRLSAIGSDTSGEVYSDNNFNVKGTTMKLNNGSASIVYNSTTESIDFVFS